MKKLIILMITCMLTLSLVSCGQKSNKEEKSITVSAAASLKEVLEKLTPEFEKNNGVDVTFNFAGSGTLQKQIEEGAPVDIFISAGKKQMDVLQEKNIIDLDSRKNLIGNDLVLIVNKKHEADVKDINDIIKNNIDISIGTIESVPAGAYAKETLDNLKLWDKINSKIIYAKDVKQVTNYVENGEVGAGIVYKSDAHNVENCYIAQVFDSKSHSSILYPEAIIDKSKNKDISKKFLEYLSSEEGKKVFVEYGFKTQE